MVANIVQCTSCLKKLADDVCAQALCTDLAEKADRMTVSLREAYMRWSKHSSSLLQVTYLQTHCGMSVDDVSELLNSKSGFKGLTGRADLREVLQLKDAGDEKAGIALQVNRFTDDADEGKQCDCYRDSKRPTNRCRRAESRKI